MKIESHVVVACLTAESQVDELEQHRQDVSLAIAVLQNDRDRDVRYLAAQLSNVTFSTSDAITGCVKLCCYLLTARNVFIDSEVFSVLTLMCHI